MLMPRLQHPSTYTPEMNLALSMQHQQHHVNQLLSTAAAANGIVGDVDALLTPIHSTPVPPPPPAQQSSAPQLNWSRTRPSRNLWTLDEVMQMLTIMQSIGAVKMLNDKTVRSDMIFRRVESMMNQRGYRKKSQIQIWTKWKFLKSTYTTTKRNGTVPKMIQAPVYEMLKTMLDNYGGDMDNSECGNSVTSLDGDSSNGGGGSRIMISGVEGGYNSGNNGEAGESEEDSALGMAHPIFGFRLGLVKQEPADVGYENAQAVDDEGIALDENNPTSSSLQTATANVQLQTIIKEEPPEIPSSPPLVITQTPSVQPIDHSTPVLTPIRPSISPAVSSPQIPTPQKPNGDISKPPIRIAPFAKVASDNVMNRIARSPPPLQAAPGIPRPVRLSVASNLTNVGVNGIASQRQLPQPAPLPPGLRLSKNVTVQAQRPPIAPNPNMLRLKQMPSRKSAPPMQPERVVPDVESTSSTSLQEAHLAHGYMDGPSTSKQALRMNSQQRYSSPSGGVNKNKRRLDIPWNDTVKNPAKMQRCSTKSNLGAPKQMQSKYFEAPDEDDDMSSEHNSFERSASQQPSENGKSFKASAKEQEYFDQALQELSTALRETQREMLNDFFKQQMEMARKEHSFQMRQDVLIMQAFTEQSNNFMKMAKKLIGEDRDEGAESKDEEEEENCEAEAQNQEGKHESSGEKNEVKKTKAQTDMTERLMQQAQQAPKIIETLEDTSDDEEESDDEADGMQEYENDHYNQNEQFEYEDDEYLQDTTADMDNDDNGDENGGSVDDGDMDEEGNADEQGSEATESDRDDDDDDTDPIQMVTSELIEDN